MISILIVTYGNRWTMLKTVILSLIDLDPLVQIVIVDNGTNYDLEKLISNISIKNKINILRLEKNMGSAYGFKFGLEYIMYNKNTEFVWMLDDDNKPVDNCLDHILHYWYAIKSISKNEMHAILPLRINRKYLVNVSNGDPIEFNFPSKNAFLGFNLIRLPAYFKYKISKAFKKKSLLNARDVEIPFAPYGGLFLHKNLINLIGLPDIKYFLYADDFEYTNRITNSGGRIFLLHRCKIVDLDSVWYRNRRSTILGSRYLLQDKFRRYYTVRNNVYFAHNFLCSSKMLFIFNMFLFLFIMLLTSILFLKINTYKVFLRAVRDGMVGNFQNDIE
ncbi:MAG: glycosyltransferase [Chitinophagales bacterium]|nr:glycosyltransferase [Chitinophagales bacterium]